MERQDVETVWRGVREFFVRLGGLCAVCVFDFDWRTDLDICVSMVPVPRAEAGLGGRRDRKL